MERRLLSSLARGMLITERQPGRLRRTRGTLSTKHLEGQSALQLGSVYRNDLGRRVQVLVQIRSVDQAT